MWIVLSSRYIIFVTPYVQFGLLYLQGSVVTQERKRKC